MKGKILLVVGVGIGYVLGTRAGREQYDKITAAAQKLWNDPRVQQQVDNAQGFVKDKAPEVAEFLADNAKKVVSQVSGTQGTGSSGTGSSGTGYQGTGSQGSVSKPVAKAAAKPAASSK